MVLATAACRTKIISADVTWTHSDIYTYVNCLSHAALDFFIFGSIISFFQWCHMCIWCYTHELEMQDTTQPFNCLFGGLMTDIAYTQRRKKRENACAK